MAVYIPPQAPAPGQAFFVAAASTDVAQIQFTPSMRTVTGGDDFISGAPMLLNHFLKLKLYHGNSEKENTKVISLFNRKYIIYASSIAAAILLLFNLSVFDKKISWEDIDLESFENYIIAISNIGLISNKYVKLDYKDMVEIKNDNKIKSYQPELPSLLFSKAIEYDVSTGNEIEIENFNLGGKDKLGRDNSLKLKKIKSGFFKNPDYTSPRNFFINCFESADSNK